MPEGSDQPPGLAWGRAADQVLPGTSLCPEQAIDETAEPIGLLDHRFWYRDPAYADQPESGSEFLALAVCAFDVLRSIAHRSAIGLGKPKRSIIGSSIQLVLQRSDTTLLQLYPVDRGHELEGYLESDEIPTPGRETTLVGHRARTVARGVTGRGCVLAHASPQGGQWTDVKGPRVGERPRASLRAMRAGGGALDLRPLVAYPPGLSKHTPPSSHTGHRILAPASPRDSACGIGVSPAIPLAESAFPRDSACGIGLPVDVMQ